MYLALALHNHQPVGNFGWVFQEAYDGAYLPMLECLERHPKIRLALHYTGPLRDWLNDNQPEFLPRLRTLAGRGQIEIMTGSYYEAVLASLMDVDKVGQIKKLTAAVKADFDYDATGLWLAERIWEPHLAASLSEAGIEYTIVDDTHFKAVGYRDRDLLGYYVTEEQGKTLKIFGTSMALRYSIPWKPVKDTIEWLREQAEMDDMTGQYAGKARVAVMGDDGEKFGMWPGTYQSIWIEGWMDQFFEAIEENADWLETIPPGDAARELPGLGRTYLPTSSYDEMGEWAMPPDEAQELHQLKQQLNNEGKTSITKYMRGGLWRNFMVKYPEVNQLHKKALWVSRKAHAMPAGKRKDDALDHLWAGQCNCGYWHGVFGGVYLFHIREADYRHLIMAENAADGVGGDAGKSFARVEIADFDHDGLGDVVITTDRQNLVVDPDQGGGLVEWDFRAAGYNLLNVVARRREGYHQTLLEATAAGMLVTPGMEEVNGAPKSIHSEIVRAREPGLNEKLIYDWHPRTSLLDHFPGKDVGLESFYRANYEELGDFVNQPYSFTASEAAGGGALVTLRREGKVWQGATQRPVTVEKRLRIDPGSDRMLVDYEITAGDGKALATRFGVELNWGLAGGNDAHTSVTIGSQRFSLGEIGENDDVTETTIASDLWGIEIVTRTDRAATLWRFPLETVSASEGGFERNYQGTTMMLWWPINIIAKGRWRVAFEFALKYSQR